MLRMYTGENRLLSGELLRRIGDALAQEDAVQYIVVPRQLTLWTERLLLSGLRLRGSFRLRVISAARLCGRIFEAAGAPEGVRIDERGRVMLVRRAIANAKDLTIYRNMGRRFGFAEKCAAQIELLMQGGVTPEHLRSCAKESEGTNRMKLCDLAAIFEAYSELIAGRYQDGEYELLAAAERVPQADFVRESHFWFFGYDITPPTLNGLIAAIGAVAPDADLFFPLINDSSARDYDCYRPVEAAYGRIARACADVGVQIRRIPVEEAAKADELRTLARELYANPMRPWSAQCAHVRLTYARDVREECMLAAATARRLAMRGMRYGDMQLLCADLDSRRADLIEAFEAYGVPIFLDNSRAVSRMATAECLLTALRLIEKNFRSEDVLTLMRCGYMDLTQDEAARLANYAVRRGIEGQRWLRPLNRGSEAEIAELEPVRARLMAPLDSLRSALRAAKDLKAQLRALVGFLQEIHAYERSLALQREMIEQGLREQAGALSQAWNRVMGALDQMAELMGAEKLGLRELMQTLTESLDAAVVKALPQSGDAVYAQGVNRMLMQPARALIVVGMANDAAAPSGGLLTAEECRALARHSGAYLGQDETDAARVRRFYMKSALGMATQEVCFFCALSGKDGAALRPGIMVEMLRRLFPRMWIPTNAETQALLACAPRAALICAARALSAAYAGEAAQEGDRLAASALRACEESLPEEAARLRRMEHMLDTPQLCESVRPDHARALYGQLQYQSITRLERFARCPFSYYVAYGLRPDIVEPFELDRRQEGTFLHAAVNEFLRESGRDLNAMPPEDASARMARIADRLLEDMRIGTPMEDSAVARAQSRALRASACRCAEILAAQMRDSAFYTDQLERSFGRENGRASLRAGDTVLEGRIDRLDFWREGNSLRVIDFKLGGKPLNLAGAYHGLELQLPVYLGEAMRARNARSAGVYYFALEEGVVDTQSVDPIAVEKERARQFRMTGLLPEDAELIRAQTPNPAEVFHARMTSEGKPYAEVPRASDADFDRLVRHALKQAGQHVRRIRGGEARIQPMNFDGRDACAWCDHRAACLFDPKLNANRVRRPESMKWNEVLERIALEDAQE